MIDTAVEALSVYTVQAADPSFQATTDSGPAVLAALMGGSGHAAATESAWAALDAWLDQLRGGTLYPGVFGGLAGFYAGAQTAVSFCPALESLAAVLRDSIVKWSEDGEWRTEAVAWDDYDLISGPAGIVLSLATDPECPAQSIVPAARHLATLCDSDALERVRIGAYLEDEQRAWNYGRINTGLAHGVTGIAAALRAALEIAQDPGEFSVPLQRVCRWLVDESYIDDLGLRTWPPAGVEGGGYLPGASRRQAWCYGTPGVAWTLWEAARVLDDGELRAFAEDAIRSFCRAFNEDLYIDSSPVSSALGICHGAAGTLAITDAFVLHAGLKEAAILRNRLEAYLLARIHDVQVLAREDMTLLTGASGVLAVLLMLQGGQRTWLSHIALR